MDRYYSKTLPWEKTPYRAARVDLSKIPAQDWTQELFNEFPKLLKGIIHDRVSRHCSLVELGVLLCWKSR